MAWGRTSDKPLSQFLLKFSPREPTDNATAVVKNGLGTNKRQAIISQDYGRDRWYKYASLGLDVLNTNKNNQESAVELCANTLNIGDATSKLF